MKTKVITKRYAEVEFDFWDFRVHENGTVQRWEGEDWQWLTLDDDDYDIVREAGLAALKEAQ